MKTKKTLFGITGLIALLYAVLLASCGSTPAQTEGTVDVFIEGGTFIMGSPANEGSRGSDEVQHRVTVSSFYIVTPRA